MILLAPLPAQAAGLIVNGSFEADGLIDIATYPLTGWDVNIPANFGGDIRDDWATQDSNSLRLYTIKYQSFTAGENAMISQQVDLSEANEITFDIYLHGYGLGDVPWDSNKVTAFVSIDSNNVWQSAPSYNGIYYDVNIPSGDYTGIHLLSFGIRADVSQYITVSYLAQWDFVKLDTFCGGFGYLNADFNYDCYVDFGDMEIMAGNWLRNDLTPIDDYLDLNPDGNIDLFDFAAFAEEWMLCSDWRYGDCAEVPLESDADINLDGIVNFADYAILSSDWGASGIVDYNDIRIMNARWLQKNWLYRN